MSDASAATFLTKPTTEPTTEPAAPPKDDDVIYDPDDDLLPPPKPASDSPTRTNATSLVVVKG